MASTRPLCQPAGLTSAYDAYEVTADVLWEVDKSAGAPGVSVGAASQREPQRRLAAQTPECSLEIPARRPTPSAICRTKHSRGDVGSQPTIWVIRRSR